MKESFFNIKLKLLSKGKILKVTSNIGRSGTDKVELNKEFQKNLGDKGLLQKDLYEIGQRVAYRIAQNIYEKKKPDGSRQQRNSDEWIKAKGFDHPVLETGKLLQSIKAVKDGGNVIVRIAETSYPMRTSKRKNIKNRVLTTYTKPTTARPKVKQVAKWLHEKGYTFFGVKKGFYKEAIRDTVLKRLAGKTSKNDGFGKPFSKLSS